MLFFFNLNGTKNHIVYRKKPLSSLQICFLGEGGLILPLSHKRIIYAVELGWNLFII